MILLLILFKFLIISHRVVYENKFVLLPCKLFNNNMLNQQQSHFVLANIKRAKIELEK
jgi:hypothetical protein